eukprot:4302596-Alexandrium_andersonii.AAC.1
MSASLVGSEMCIRDSLYTATRGTAKRRPKSLCQSTLACGTAPVCGVALRGPQRYIVDRVCPCPTGR